MSRTRRWAWILLVCLVLLPALCPPAGATEPEEVEAAQAEALDLDGLRRAAEGELSGLEIGSGLDLDQGIEQIFDKGRDELPGVLRRAVRSAVVLLSVVLLCALAGEVSGSLGAPAELDVTALAGALAVTAASVADIHALIGLGREALDRMSQFSKVLLPTMTAAAAAAGAPSGAAARQLATMLFSDVLLTLINSLLLPLVYLYVAACTAYAALGNEGLKRVGELLKWAVTSILTAVVLAFVGYLTVSGVIAGSADAVTLKAAKMTISGMVPVVGGILSDAAGTVLAGAGILRGAVGVFGMLGVLAICVAPFLQLGVHYLVYKLTAALSATVAGGRMAGLIDAIGGAFGLVLGMTGASALLLLVSMVSAITMAVGGV
ncbi:MAG: stage III sporulation protein AE [Clostridiales bacterium]|nr:stage III sporulation protein AE [Clostridiales bacterium]MDY4181402.1 stage III sporulation protein AE [Pseudoflavonifractor sp.]